jgi:hypothetical protein
MSASHARIVFAFFGAVACFMALAWICVAPASCDARTDPLVCDKIFQLETIIACVLFVFAAILVAGVFLPARTQRSVYFSAESHDPANSRRRRGVSAPE